MLADMSLDDNQFHHARRYAPVAMVPIFVLVHSNRSSTSTQSDNELGLIALRDVSRSLEG